MADVAFHLYTVRDVRPWGESALHLNVPGRTPEEAIAEANRRQLAAGWSEMRRPVAEECWTDETARAAMTA